MRWRHVILHFLLFCFSEVVGFHPHGRHRSTPAVMLYSPHSSQDLPAGLLADVVKAGVEEEIAAQAVEVAAKAMQSRKPTATPFLAAPDGRAIQGAFKKVSGLRCVLNGGFGRAERRRLVVSRVGEGEGGADVVTPAGLFEALSISGDFLFSPCTASDFEQEILQMLSVDQRGLLGDVLVTGERGAQCVVDPAIVAPLANGLSNVAGVAVTTERIPMSELCVREPVRKDLQSVEGSLRIDAVGSAGLGMSRSKVAKMIKAGTGELLLNGRPATSASTSLKAGDTVSTRSKGLVEIKSIETTAKGRYRILMTRFS